MSVAATEAPTIIWKKQKFGDEEFEVAYREAVQTTAYGDSGRPSAKRGVANLRR